jgi:short subunit dehydrogenase-like uncharacterized protein
MNERKFDIVIYGATGFTGALVAEYFAKNVDSTNIKWAIAGRNLEKLEAVKQQLISIQPACESLELIIADGDVEASLLEMAASTKILITTVGPYAKYGRPVVAACIAEKTHYLDITGEPEFVKEILEEFDDAAQSNEVLVLNCCGFDSIPADAGAYFTASQFDVKDKITIKGYVSAKGNFSGGTWQSAILAMSKIASSSKESITLDSFTKQVSKPALPSIHKVHELSKWALPMPVIDPWMVKRSSEARPEVYGSRFKYGQYISLKNIPTMAVLLMGVAGVGLAAQWKPTRDLLLSYKKSGDGPSAEERANSFFKINFIGESSHQKVQCTVSGGDPGYTETAKMLSEAALTLLQNYEELPFKGGVMTPAGALGDHLINRLKAAGIWFEVIA